MKTDFRMILEHLEKRPKRVLGTVGVKRYYWVNPNGRVVDDIEIEVWFVEHERLCKAFEKELQYRECHCARHSIYDDKRDSEWKLIREILRE